MTITSTMPPQQIARILARHCIDHDVRFSRFGRNAANDPRLIYDLHNGRTPRAKMVEQINAALAGEA